MASTKKKKTEIRTSVYIPKKMVPFAKVYLFSNPYHSIRAGGLK